jgi:hypothetical protein
MGQSTYGPKGAMWTWYRDKAIIVMNCLGGFSWLNVDAMECIQKKALIQKILIET